MMEQLGFLAVWGSRVTGGPLLGMHWHRDQFFGIRTRLRKY